MIKVAGFERVEGIRGLWDRVGPRGRFDKAHNEDRAQIWRIAHIRVSWPVTIRGGQMMPQRPQVFAMI